MPDFAEPSMAGCRFTLVGPPLFNPRRQPDDCRPSASMPDYAPDYARRGDLAKLQATLVGPVDNELKENVICLAATGGHAATINWLIDVRFPDYAPHLQSHLAAIDGGAGVYKLFVKKWPYLIDLDLGHGGNPIGLAILCDDKALVELILSMGVDPNTAHYSHKPVG